jgi:hypothetical protein
MGISIFNGGEFRHTTSTSSLVDFRLYNAKCEGKDREKEKKGGSYTHGRVDGMLICLSRRRKQNNKERIACKNLHLSVVCTAHSY